MNRTLRSKDNEILKTIHREKDPKSFTSKFYQIFKEEKTTKLTQSLSENRRGRSTFPLVLWAWYYPNTRPKASKEKTPAKEYSS